ncbi:MAG: CDP-diacylglycerol--serine O-phosphatidyltransferase [Steroidobacteraceae bacterium]|jgi:CDP-diacylglycerol--serine O-phosphatidyltransferase
MTEEPKPRTPRRGAFLLPNLLTTGCLFSGFYAVVAAIDGNLIQGAMAIFLAMVFDGLDGRVARMTGTESLFGKEYDSLADMVAFGLAPAIVCYQWGVDRIAEYGLAWGRLGWVAAFFYTAAGALRLARFNARTVADKRYFEGLPSPSAAAVVAAFVWLATKYGLEGLPALVLGFLVTATAGALMVSRHSYASFKHRATSERVRYSRLLLIPLVFSLIAINPPVALFLLFGSYAASGPLVWSWRRLTRRRRPREE